MEEHSKGTARDGVEVKLKLDGHSVGMTASAAALRDLRKAFARLGGPAWSPTVYGHILMPSGPVARVHASADDLERNEVARAAALEQRVRDLEGAVDTYARLARAMRHLDVVGAAA